MRAWLLLLVLTLAGGLVAGTLMGFDSGYVLISWGNYTLETSLWLYAGLTPVADAVLYTLAALSTWCCWAVTGVLTNGAPSAV